MKCSPNPSDVLASTAQFILSTNLKSKRVLFFLLAGIFTFSLLYTNPGLLSTQVPDVYSKESIQEEYDEDRKNSYIVSTSKCRIPDLNPWDEAVQLLSTKCDPSDEVDPNCHQRDVRTWMYTNGSKLIVNSSAVHNSGYSLNSLRCCYRVIERVEQYLDGYDQNADSVVRYSQKCHPLVVSQANQIDHSFIRVFCMSTSIPLLDDVVYRDTFAFAHLDEISMERVKFSLGESEKGPGPNIVMIGVDTNSRLNSHRRLKGTLDLLHELDAVEMFGYTKVGENTFPNTVAFLAGLNMSELEPICFTSDADPQDDCPYIWKDFSSAGYLTATAEDAPYATGFNYLKTGFVEQPTDFYLRPFMLSVMMQPREHVWFAKCVGRLKIAEIVLNYMTEILRKGESLGAPVFIHSWLTTMTHHCINGVRFQDEAFQHFIRNAVKFPNTIVIFMSDHGDRYGKFRESTLGWYEDKLPSMWIYLPPEIKGKFPAWEAALRINARRPSSHFDLYQTFAHVLKEFGGANSTSQKELRFKRRGASFFTELPENRTCEDASIPTAYCTCSEPQLLDLKSDSAKVEEASELFVNFLEKSLPKECAKPVLKEIVSAKVMKTEDSGSGIYVISLYTDPGNFLFEVTLEEIEEKGRSKFRIESLTDVLRMNKMAREVKCIRDPVLERYCYCP